MIVADKEEMHYKKFHKPEELKNSRAKIDWPENVEK